MDRFKQFCETFANFPTLQKDLSLLDKPASNGESCFSHANKAKVTNERATDLSTGAPTPRGPPGRSGSMANQHRPMGSDDRKPYRGPPRVGDSLSPPKRPDHRRRASESSTTMGPDRRDRRDRDPNERPPRTESEERRRRERRKEREERHRREKERIRSGGKGGKPRNLDIIDKLDVTGIYGQGCKYFAVESQLSAPSTDCVFSVPPRRPIRRLQPTQERTEGSPSTNASLPRRISKHGSRWIWTAAQPHRS